MKLRHGELSPVGRLHLSHGLKTLIIGLVEQDFFGRQVVSAKMFSCSNLTIKHWLDVFPQLFGPPE